MNYFERAKFFRTKKRLGQNFLIDGEVIADIIDFAKFASAAATDYVNETYIFEDSPAADAAEKKH